MKTLVSALLVIGLVTATTTPLPAQDRERLGTVRFRTSCAAAVQPRFDRAVALLHSFALDASVAAFTDVATADPACGMAWWGVAMSWLGNPLAGPPNARGLKEGGAAVEKAKAAGAKTDRERDYIAAVEAFYKDSETLDHATRALAFQKGMEQAHLNNPQDDEAAIFYALALLGTAQPSDKSYANQKRAAELLNDVLPRAPDHPGVAHYLIHSYDYPPIAEKGLAAAKRYSKVAADAAHAQHMPSHIFTRVGYWRESVAANKASAATDSAAKVQTPHAMDYMVYAYLQLGEDSAAESVWAEAKSLKLTNPAFHQPFGLAAIPARLTLERGQWAQAAKLEQRFLVAGAGEALVQHRFESGEMAADPLDVGVGHGVLAWFHPARAFDNP